ncbi:DUF6482 family protein [Pseudomonas qingdaonensis]|uniref:DUF6482 family protein n=1 Tax=Pseudomonas qingdaonensis TaxID=2056231 RepID=UPI00265DC25B|nr:DUF6482 family protein [Pseudomonas qingdaonensis]WKL66619.1 DUF6482 family protein [Pseudomonas qingdaonensis]
MNLHELNSEARAGRVDELNLIAIEGGDFVLEARVKGKAHPLLDAKGVRLKGHSVVDGQRLLNGLPAVPLHLVHWSVQDEMCGLHGTPEEDLKVPMPRRTAW